MKVKIPKTFEIDHVFSYILDCGPLFLIMFFYNNLKCYLLKLDKKY